jgi:hypothetical protein
MRFVSPAEAEAVFTSPKFSVSLEHQWYRSALCLDPACAASQIRVAAEQPESLGDIPNFAGRLNRWLPTGRARMLWVDHWEDMTFCGAASLVEAAWRGLGERRSFRQAPGLHLDPQIWDEQDQTAVSPAHADAIGALVGLIALVMMSYSDGWLISADCPDRIEFWEGRFFFHSSDARQLESANAIIDAFGCKRWKT